MRARILFAAGLVAALAGACSDAPADRAVDIDPDLASKLDLALSSAAEAVEPAVEGERPIPVASAIEAPRPPATEPRPERVRRRPAAVTPRPQRPAEVPVVAAAEPEPQLEQAPEEAEEPRFTLSPWPRTADIDGSTTAREGRGSPAGDGGRDDGEVDGQGREGGNGQILIRGGTSRRDPCAIHMPRGAGIAIAIGGILLGGRDVRDQLGAAGVLVNDRAPRNPVFRPDDERRAGRGSGPTITIDDTRRAPRGSHPVFRRGSLR